MKIKRYIGTRLGLAVISSALLSSTALTYAQTPVRDLDNPARQPFRKVFANLEIRTRPLDAGATVVRVPEGKRLVIEQITFRTDVPLNRKLQGIHVSLLTELADQFANATYPVPVQQQLNEFIVNQQMRIYVDPTKAATLRIAIESDTEDVLTMIFRDIVISGYFVDLT